MPLVLMQRAWRDDPKYKDTEFVVYHYPQRYFDQISGGEKMRLLPPIRWRGCWRGEHIFRMRGELGNWWSRSGRPNAPVCRHPEADSVRESHTARQWQDRMYESEHLQGATPFRVGLFVTSMIWTSIGSSMLPA